MTSDTFTPDSTLVRTTRLPSAELSPKDTVLLDAEKGVYYGLEGPARDIWDMLENETSLNAICAALLQKYDVEEDQCMKDTQNFINDLIENGLVSVI